MMNAQLLPPDDGEVLLHGASVARTLGSEFVARVLEAGERQLARAPLVMRLIRDWPGDPVRAAVAMRFNGALHALARQSGMPDLTELYARQTGDFDAPIGEALAREEDFIAAWMQRPPQTNEVGRSAAIVAALMVAQQDGERPLELLELGSSAGLNLNLAHYGYDLGGVTVGDPASTVQIAPDWTGPHVPLRKLEIVDARGVDLDPLDPADTATRDRLLAYVWADQPERAERLNRALAIAQAHPPRIDRADARSWIADRLDRPQQDGVGRVIFQSMVLQYLAPDALASVSQTIAQAGRRATTRRPLFWIGYEWNVARTEVALHLTRWPDGEVRTLARCHAYARWIDWTGR